MYVNDCESIGRAENAVLCPFGMALRRSEYNYWHLDTTGRDSCKRIVGNSHLTYFFFIANRNSLVASIL